MVTKYNTFGKKGASLAQADPVPASGPPAENPENSYKEKA